MSKKQRKQKQRPEQQKWSDGRPGQGIHAFVATPAYDGRVLTDFAISLAESCQVATVWGIQVTATVMGNGAFIDLARNKLVEMFLASNATHLFFIDADLKWEPRAFVSLLMSGKRICAGVYPKRQDPEEYPCRPAPAPEGGGLWVDEENWIMCNRVPTGFLCIRRDVIEEMAADVKWIKSPQQSGPGAEPPMPRLFYTYLNENDSFVGEDFAFCDDYVRKYGEPIPVWPDFDFTHDRRWKGNWHAFLNRLVEEEENAATIKQQGEQIEANNEKLAEMVKEAA